MFSESKSALSLSVYRDAFLLKLKDMKNLFEVYDQHRKRLRNYSSFRGALEDLRMQRENLELYFKAIERQPQEIPE